MKRTKVANVRSRLVVLVLLAVTPSFALLAFRDFEARSDAVAEARQDARRTAQFAAARHRRISQDVTQTLFALAHLAPVKAGNAASCNELFSSLLSLNPHYDNITAAWANGDVFASGIPIQNRTSVANSSSFNRVINDGAQIRGEFEKSIVTGRLCEVFRYPIADPGGKTRIVVTALLDLQWVNEFSRDADLPPGSVLTLFDSQGTVLARSADEERYIGQRIADSELVSAVLERHDGTLDLPGLDQVPRLQSFTRLDAGQDNAPIVTVGVPVSVVYSGPNKRMLRDLLVLAAAAAVTALAALTGGDRLFLRGIKSVMSAARRLDRGDLSARAGLEGGPAELRELAETFDGMAEALQERDRQRREAEEQLLASKARLAGIIESAMDGIVTVDADQQIVLFNRAAEEMFGRCADEVLGRQLELLIPGGIIDATGDQIATFGQTSVTAGRMGLLGAISGRRADGSEFPIEASISQVATGDQKFFTIILRDITGRTRAEEKLRKSEERFSKAFRVGVYPLSITRLADGLYIDVNDSFLRAVGYSREQVIGHTSVELGLWTEPERRAGIVADLEAGRSVREVELRYRNKRGEERVWLVSADIIEIDGERCIIGTRNDITERQKAEEEVRRLNAELERRVEERTAQLETSNKELESFCYSVSHDLRAPLRSITGFSKALAEDYHEKLDETGRNYLDRVCAATENMAQLIDDLLDLSRVTRAEMKREKIDLGAIARSVVAEHRRFEPERRVSVDIEDDLVAEGDRALMRVVLENLLSNAWKFTSKNDEARIEFGRAADKGNGCFRVRDNGAGFDMAYANKLFGPFQRLHSVKQYPGTGIGLATVQRIIRRHGGRVWAEAEVDKGATFYFTL
jgi:PAS domain S-box-containing protein